MSDERSPRPVAIVTGAARGIGAAVARRLARDGLAVAVLDRDVDERAEVLVEIEAARGRGFALEVDVADEAAVRAAVNETARVLGPPLVLVNNAGIARAAPVESMPAGDWDDVLAVDLRGPFLMTRAVVPHMLDAGWGRVVNIASISAFGDPGRVAYASAKAGLVGLTRTLALELGPRGITVNAVAPGFVVSDMTAATARRLGRDFAEHQRLAAASIPVRRVGLPDDVARAVAFFAGEDAGFVTGQVLAVSGGPGCS